MKPFHEVRDPIYGFIRFSTDERSIIDTRAFQRLRDIHQLALSYFVYPGASHKRFEHSLGVMELATRIFENVTRHENVHPKVIAQLPELADSSKVGYWKQVVRAAALCHDLGHLPFSHAGESLIEDGKNHEDLSRLLIDSEELRSLWQGMRPPLNPEDILKIALGPKDVAVNFSAWEGILAEIITGDVLGADRMDYLLRDAYHAGAAFGRFDVERLISRMRILPAPPEDDKDEPNGDELKPVLGVDEGGLPAAETLLIAGKIPNSVKI